MAWGDVDSDGDYDVFVGGASGQAGGVFLNNGRGGFVGTQQKYLGSLVVRRHGSSLY